MPDLRHDPYRARSSSAPGIRRARSEVAGSATASGPRRQACGRGDAGSEGVQPGTNATQSTRETPAEKSGQPAEIRDLCHRVSRAGWGRLSLRAILDQQSAGHREFQTGPNRLRRQSHRVGPPGRSEWRYGRVGDTGWRFLRLTSAASCPCPTASGRANTSRPNCPRRSPGAKGHERHLAGEVQAAWWKIELLLLDLSRHGTLRSVGYRA